MNKNDYISEVDALKVSDSLKEELLEKSKGRSVPRSRAPLVIAACFAAVIIFAAVQVPNFRMGSKSADSAQATVQETMANEDGEVFLLNSQDSQSDYSLHGDGSAVVADNLQADAILAVINEASATEKRPAPDEEQVILSIYGSNCYYYPESCIITKDDDCGFLELTPEQAQRINSIIKEISQ